MTPGEPGVSDFGISAGGGDGGGIGHTAHAEHPDGDPRFALAAAVRRVVTAMVASPVPDEETRALTAEVESVADRLEAVAGPGRRPRVQPDPTGPPQDFFPTSPVIGHANPVAPPVLVEATDGGLVGSAWFDYQYEGPPGCVHGGVIALTFDELLGATGIATGQPGMTGTLTIRYRRPTPLRTPLRLEARFVGRQGRKITIHGAIYDGDTLTAEAEGLFIELLPERFVEVIGEQNAVAAEVFAQIQAEAVAAGIRPAALGDEGRDATPAG
ncbi:MAG TPA: PaaI family thioesterase [Acidimicrobiales bacterium]|nr:PaaI family thioesterase [Acidimicrobiales bacterium]